MRKLLWDLRFPKESLSYYPVDLGTLDRIEAPLVLRPPPHFDLDR